MRHLLGLAIALSCSSICDSRGYDFHTKYNGYCYCSDRYFLDGSFELPWILRWDHKQKEDKEEDQETLNPRWKI
jgi:hypothetical protein